MSFYKITDPNERRRMFEKLAKTRKSVRDNFLEDKIGKIEASESLKTFFKPVTESQEQLTEQIKPIKERVLATIQPPAAGLMNVGPVAKEYLEKYGQADKTFGIYSVDKNVWKIGNKEIRVDGDDFIVEGDRYPGTRGLWELVVKHKPDKDKFTEADYETYAKILTKTSAMRRFNDPTEPNPKSSRSWKWANIIKPIWQKNRLEKGDKTSGTSLGTVVIPSDPNALVERLDLLMASKQAGNTGTRNELVSICDELLRQKIISKNEYKNIMLRL